MSRRRSTLRTTSKKTLLINVYVSSISPHPLLMRRRGRITWGGGRNASQYDVAVSCCPALSGFSGIGVVNARCGGGGDTKRGLYQVTRSFVMGPEEQTGS